MKTISLYELGQQYLDLLEMEIEGEEDANAFTALMEKLDGDIRDKIENCALVVQSLAWTEKVARDEAARLTKRAQAYAAKADRLKAYMQDVYESTGQASIKTPRISVWVQDNPPHVVIDDPGAVPAEYMVTPEPYVDKRILADKLKAGESLPFARLEKTRGIRIR
jgi:hypothetical protein